MGLVAVNGLKGLLRAKHPAGKIPIGLRIERSVGFQSLGGLGQQG